MSIRSLLLATSLLTAGHVAAQTTDENMCRSADSIYSASAYGNGTASGFAGEYIILRSPNGSIIDRRTVGQWCDWYFANLGRNVSRRYVNDVVFHSSGRISIRFNYSAWSCYGVALPGGTVEVQRNGFVIDRDRLF